MTTLWYRDGTVAVTAGSKVVTGTDTLWKYAEILDQGDIFTLDGTRLFEVASIDSDTQLTLTEDFVGTTGTGLTYSIIPNYAVRPYAPIIGRQMLLINKWLIREQELADWQAKPASSDPANPTKVTLTAWNGLKGEYLSLPQLLSMIGTAMDWTLLTNVPANITAWQNIAPASKQDYAPNLTDWSATTVASMASQAWVEANYVSLTGDTMTGNLVMNNASVLVNGGDIRSYNIGAVTTDGKIILGDVGSSVWKHGNQFEFIKSDANGQAAWQANLKQGGDILTSLGNQSVNGPMAFNEAVTVQGKFWAGGEYDWSPGYQVIMSDDGSQAYLDAKTKDGSFFTDFDIRAATLRFNGAEVFTTTNFTPGNYLPLIGGTLTGALTINAATNQLRLNGTTGNGYQLVTTAADRLVVQSVIGATTTTIWQYVPNQTTHQFSGTVQYLGLLQSIATGANTAEYSMRTAANAAAGVVLGVVSGTNTTGGPQAQVKFVATDVFTGTSTPTAVQLFATAIGATTPSLVFSAAHAGSTLSSPLTVAGAATLSSTLAVTGNTTIGGTLGVTGNTTIGGVTNLNNAVNITGLTIVTGNTHLRGDQNFIGGRVAQNANKVRIFNPTAGQTDVRIDSVNFDATAFTPLELRASAFTFVDGGISIARGAVATQSVLLGLGYSNKINRWNHVMESDASYSLYAYDTSGGAPIQMMQIRSTNAGGLNGVGIAGKLAINGAAFGGDNYGVLTVQGGIKSLGTSSAQIVTDRTSGAEWHMYSDANQWRVWNNVSNSDIISAGTGGEFKVANNLYLGAGWFRSQQSGTGWYSEPHGGGIYMNDNTWVRVYNNKSFLVAGEARIESSAPTISTFDTDEGITSWIHNNGGMHGFLKNNEYAWCAYRTGDNNWVCTGNIAAYASDARLKKNYRPLADPLGKLARLDAIEFDWDMEVCEKAGHVPQNPTEHGVLAQQIQQVFPEWVVPAAFNKDYYTVLYDRLSVFNLAVNKAQQKIIDAQSVKIREQDDRIKDLEVRMAKMMARFNKWEADHG